MGFNSLFSISNENSELCIFRPAEGWQQQLIPNFQQVSQLTIPAKSYDKCRKSVYFCEWLLGSKQSIEVEGKWYVVSTNDLENLLRQIDLKP